MKHLPMLLLAASSLLALGCQSARPTARVEPIVSAATTELSELARALGEAEERRAEAASALPAANAEGVEREVVIRVASAHERRGRSLGEAIGRCEAVARILGRIELPEDVSDEAREATEQVTSLANDLEPLCSDLRLPEERPQALGEIRGKVGPLREALDAVKRAVTAE